MGNNIKFERNKIGAVDFDGVDHRDYPDYCDAYVVYAEYDGAPMTDQQLDELNEDRDIVYELLMNKLN